MALSHIALRGVMAAASLGLVALPYAASGGLHLVAAALVVLTAVAVVRLESVVVTALLLCHAVHWTASAPVPERMAQWLALLAGAWLVILVHVCASAAVTWPAAARVPRHALLRWARRTAVVALGVVPVWAVCAATSEQSLRGEVSMTYVAIAGLALLGGTIFYLHRPAAPSQRR